VEQIVVRKVGSSGEEGTMRVLLNEKLEYFPARFALFHSFRALSKFFRAFKGFSLSEIHVAELERNYEGSYEGSFVQKTFCARFKFFRAL
jgi:hypothetical protein